MAGKANIIDKVFKVQAVNFVNVEMGAEELIHCFELSSV